MNYREKVKEQIARDRANKGTDGGEAAAVSATPQPAGNGATDPPPQKQVADYDETRIQVHDHFILEFAVWL